MKKLFYLSVILICCSFYCYSQVHFPFKTGDKQSSVLAYWYNCKSDTAVFEGINHKSWLHSTLQIYGPFISDSFYVKAEVFFPNNNKAYINSFLVKKDLENKEYSVSVVNDYFLLISIVPQSVSNPEKIKITISAPGEQILEKMIYCKYHKLYGQMYDFRGNPLRAFIMIYPDSFKDACGVWSDSTGYYEIDLPERTYNVFYVSDGKYKSTSLEAWAWHIIMDNDQELDFKIGTGEVYNLNVWANNGGNSALLLSFRPMVLYTDDKTTDKQVINDKEFSLIDIAPDLDIGDFNITVNGERVEIFSLQKYFETSRKNAMPAYIIQIPRKSPTMGKQTIRVEYEKTIEKDGKILFQNSMGYFQVYLNFFGYSDFN